jgi:transposase-like protein
MGKFRALDFYVIRSKVWKESSMVECLVMSRVRFIVHTCIYTVQQNAVT